MNKFISTITLMLFDVVAIFLAIALAVSLRQILNIFFDLPVIGYSYLSFVSVYITLLFILFYFGVYTKRFDFWHEARIVVRSSFLSFVIVLAELVLGQNAEYYSRSTLILIFSAILNVLLNDPIKFLFRQIHTIDEKCRMFRI